MPSSTSNPASSHGAQLNQASDTYAGISGGGGNGLEAITGVSPNAIGLSASMGASQLNAITADLGVDFAAKDEILVATPSADNGNLVGSHMFEVVGVNAAAGTVTLQNPWNTSYSGPLSMRFTETLAQLAADQCGIYATGAL